MKLAVKVPMTCLHWSQPSIAKFPALPRRLELAHGGGLLRQASGYNPAKRGTASIRACSISLDLSGAMEPRRRDGFLREAGEAAYCSVKRAFANTVLIIRELHSYTLQMRKETMLYKEDLEGILVRVHREIHASFVWLFQQVFSHTPALMVSVMILLANYSVHSMASAPAAVPPRPPAVFASEEEQSRRNQNFDSLGVKTSFWSSSNGRSASIGGGSGGGGKYPLTTSGIDGGGDEEGRALEEVFGYGQAILEEESRLWKSIQEEAARMQGSGVERMPGFVCPIDARISVESSEEEDCYAQTELGYKMGLAQEPNNALLLANYAQFLFMVAQDYDRAEEYFKRAAAAEPKDAEALNKYATFLWRARSDLWAAEQTYQAAVDAEPNNPFYAANYAHFLWNTGGDDTCFLLDGDDDVV
ncbi:hypothetical protein DM860_000029 [Cuscuta australis]|uniref:Uncharacterized protein n=1 Tax=Cuscuta australis TaxID=267555 RepID=A0A328CVM8_9ASTE|nr:hypothetical protein DM860_000029 [Cuscuta australis]